MQITKINKNYKKLKIQERGCSQIYMEQHFQCKYIEFVEQYNNDLYINIDRNQWISLHQLIELHRDYQASKIIVLKIVGKIIQYIQRMNEKELFMGIQNDMQECFNNIWITYQNLNQIYNINDIQILIIDLSNTNKSNRLLFQYLYQWLNKNNICDEVLKDMLKDYKQDCNLEGLYQYIESVIDNIKYQHIEGSSIKIVHNSQQFVKITNEIDYMKQNYKQFKDYFITILQNELQINLKQYIQQLDLIIFKDNDQILNKLEVQSGLFELNNYLLLKISFESIIYKLQMNKTDLYWLCNGLIYFNYDENMFKESIQEQKKLYLEQMEVFYHNIRHNIQSFSNFADINMYFCEKIIENFKENHLTQDAIPYVENILIQGLLSYKVDQIRQENFIKAQSMYIQDQFKQQLQMIIDQEISKI